MGLRIVYGRAGSGKTSYCFNEIKNIINGGRVDRANSGVNNATGNKVDNSIACNAHTAGQKPILLIVPEQFSLQAEKNLARLSGAMGICRAEVLSFRRLAFRVFSEVGGITRRHLDSSGKSMLLFRILDKLGGELKVFSRAALRKGFTETLSDAITEFKRYDITPEELAVTTDQLQDGLPLKDKLRDLSLVYSEFENMLHKNYLDADDDLMELYKKLDESNQYDGAEIWIDEFSGFTPQEYKVIIKLLKKAARVTVCLCTDCLSNDPGDNAPMVFGPVRNTAVKLLRLAVEEGISIEKPVKLSSMEGLEWMKDSGIVRGTECKEITGSVSSGKADAESSEKADAESSEKADAESSGKADAESSRKADAGSSEKADAESSGKADPVSSGKADAENSGKANPESSGKADAESSEKADAESSGKADPESSERSGTKGVNGLRGFGKRSIRFKDSEALGHLEQNFYKYPYEKYTKLSNDICIMTSANPYSEVEDTARDIIRLCRECGYRYRDIAVTMRNPDSYSGIVKSVFKRFGIPFFLDGKRDIDGHPLIVLTLSALEIFSSSWSYEAVFRYAKTGLLSVDRSELDILENYVLANGIRGNVWMRDSNWDYPVDNRDWHKEPSEQQTELVARINAVRGELVEPLVAFRQKTKGGTSAVEFCTALYDLLCDTGVAERVEELSNRFADEGLLDKANEYRQVWNIVMGVFSQIVEVLGEERLGTERFLEILSAGFAGHKMSLIPPALDQVLVGSIERSRSHDIKALYILGVNEGVLPGGKGDEGILSDMDRDSLDQLGLELAGNTKSRSLEERFMVYMALATPSRYLWMSYPAADRDGKALRPSRVISEVKRIVPTVSEQSTVIGSGSGLSRPSAPEPVFDEMVSQLRRQFDGERIHEGWREIYKWFKGRAEWKGKCETIIEGLNYTNQAQDLTGDRAEKLYGKPIFTSISRMEAYASCPFSFYVKYGLKARERRVFSFDPVDAGTFMHNIIDEFSRSLVKKNMSWRELDRQWCSKEVARLVERHMLSQGRSILGSSKRYIYLSERLKNTVVKALMLISRHISASSFEPAGYEVEFGENGRYPPITLELPSGKFVKMTGRIDRIDSLKNEDGTYLRIIDYKSGNRALKLGDVYYGLQLQLVTYLDAVLGMGEEEDKSEVVSCVRENGEQYEIGTTDKTGSNGPDASDSLDNLDCSDSSDGPDASDSLSNPDNPDNPDASGKLYPSYGNVLPGGVLYFRLNDPLIRCNRNSTDEEIERAIMKELRMKGLVLADVKLIREMDKEISGDSLIIPARINKDGSLGRSSAATMEQFKVLRGHVRKLLTSIGSGILDGNVKLNPYKKKANTACTYCEYRPVCQFDTTMKDNRYRILAEMDDSELWAMMGTSESKRNGDESGAS